jgi:cellobiose phosphorylase
MGYTRVASSYASVESSVLYFVPPGIDAEVWRFEVKNAGMEPRRLSVFSFAELVLGNVSLDQHESQIIALCFAEADSMTVGGMEKPPAPG